MKATLDERRSEEYNLMDITPIATPKILVDGEKTSVDVFPNTEKIQEIRDSRYRDEIEAISKMGPLDLYSSDSDGPNIPRPFYPDDKEEEKEGGNNNHMGCKIATMPVAYLDFSRDLGDNLDDEASGRITKRRAGIRWVLIGALLVTAVSMALGSSATKVNNKRQSNLSSHAKPIKK